jgi:hypothetical protein
MRGSTTFRAIALTAAAALLLQGPALGHHSFSAQYDADRPITLTGYLTKMDWRNPHVYFYMDVQNGDQVESWAFEMGSPIAMERLGWTRNSASLGDVLEVEGSLARDGTMLVNASTVVMTATGRRMFAGSSRGAGEDQ